MSAEAGYVLIWVGFGAYLAVLVAAPRLPRPFVWTAIVTLVIGFAAVPVLLSHDVYSYLDYARLGVVHGLDPYVHPPAAAPADPVYPEVEWTDATSAYGPLFTLATYPLAWLPVGLAIAVLKVSAAASVLGLAWLVGRLAPARGLDSSRAAAFVALNPLVLVHVVGGAHNDGLAMLVAMLGVAGLLAGRELVSGAALAAAAAIKVSAAVVAPFALVASARPPFRPPSPPEDTRIPSSTSIARLCIGALMAATAIGIAAYVAFGWEWLGAFGLAGENQGRTSHMSVLVTVARLTGLDATAIRAIALALYTGLFLYLLIETWRGGDWIRAAGWASLGLLLATAWLLPWYLVWALPLVALARDPRLSFLTLALTAFQLTTRIPI